MISDEEFLSRRAANRAGGPRTFVCVCGHSYSEHNLYRDPTPSSPNVYHYFECLDPSCNCRRFRSEYDAAHAPP